MSVKIDGKEFARLVGKSERYAWVLLQRRGVKMKQEHLDKVIDLICEYRSRRRHVPTNDL